MSFSSQVKQEMCTVEQEYCCKRAESYGLVYCGRYFDLSRIGILTEYEFVAKKYLDAVKFLTGYDGEYTVTDGGKYRVCIEDPTEILQLFNELGYTGREVSFKLQKNNLENECCKTAFLRGAFLSCGIVTDPEKAYHLEFCVSSAVKARAVESVLSSTDYEPGISSRGGVRLVYFKKKEDIEDILVKLGSQKGALDFIGQDIHKKICNDVNRRVNCDNANIKRICNASKKQIEAINKLIDDGRFDELSDSLKKLASLRVENPDYTLQELANEFDEEISRSGIAHRLEKLIKIANS